MMDTTWQTGEGAFAVSIAVGRAVLSGDLVVPPGARGVVLFAHGSGSSRHSPRNRAAARELQSGGLATLLIDLLTPEEEAIDLRTRHLRFDIGLLAGRLTGAVDWLTARPATRDLRIGLFGASTGAAAALVTAAERLVTVGAVVSRGGRPDLAGEPVLRTVRAPTLLIVGGDDPLVIDLNRSAFDVLPAAKHLEVIPGATHLFEEPGTLERVATLARAWFLRHLDSGGAKPTEKPGTAVRAAAVGEPADLSVGAGPTDDIYDDLADVVPADLRPTDPSHGFRRMDVPGLDHDAAEETAI